MDNVIDLHDLGHSRKLTPGELDEIEEVRYVPMTRGQADVLEELGRGLCGIGVTHNGTMLLGLALPWKVSRRAS